MSPTPGGSTTTRRARHAPCQQRTSRFWRKHQGGPWPDAASMSRARRRYSSAAFHVRRITMPSTSPRRISSPGARATIRRASKSRRVSAEKCHARPRRRGAIEYFAGAIGADSREAAYYFPSRRALLLAPRRCSAGRSPQHRRR